MGGAVLQDNASSDVLRIEHLIIFGLLCCMALFLFRVSPSLIGTNQYTIRLWVRLDRCTGSHSLISLRRVGMLRSGIRIELSRACCFSVGLYGTRHPPKSNLLN